MAAEQLPGIDVSVASPARVWNYWLGGKDHFASDREAGDRVLEVMPMMRDVARLARRQLTESVVLLVNQGVRQFLDVGSGLPTENNVHEVAQRVAPESRVVYTDSDPVVIRHAQALLRGSPQGRTDYIQADIRDTDVVLAGAARTLDFSEPVAVLLIGLLHFIPDADDPYAVVARLVEAVPSGSYIVIGHGASDMMPEAVEEAMTRYNQRASARLQMRGRPQVARFFDGLELIPPGLVTFQEWFGESAAAVEDGIGAASLLGYVGIGRKP